MAKWQDAVSEAPGGVRILIEVTAGAREARFPDGFNEWRDGRIGLRVREPAQDNQANTAVVAAAARFFGLPTAAVRIDVGATDSRETLRLAGIDASKARALLAPLLEKR